MCVCCALVPGTQPIESRYIGSWEIAAPVANERTNDRTRSMCLYTAGDGLGHLNLPAGNAVERARQGETGMEIDTEFAICDKARVCDNYGNFYYSRSSGRHPE